MTIQLPRERNKEYSWFYPFTLSTLLFLTISRETPHPTTHNQPHPTIAIALPLTLVLGKPKYSKTLNQILCCWPFDTQPDLKWTVCAYKRSPYHIKGAHIIINPPFQVPGSYGWQKITFGSWQIHLTPLDFPYGPVDPTYTHTLSSLPLSPSQSCQGKILKTQTEKSICVYDVWCIFSFINTTLISLLC